MFVGGPRTGDPRDATVKQTPGWNTHTGEQVRSNIVEKMVENHSSLLHITSKNNKDTAKESTKPPPSHRLLKRTQRIPEGVLMGMN